MDIYSRALVRQESMLRSQTEDENVLRSREITTPYDLDIAIRCALNTKYKEDRALSLTTEGYGRRRTDRLLSPFIWQCAFMMRWIDLHATGHDSSAKNLRTG